MSITVCPVPVAVIGSRVDLASTHRLICRENHEDVG
jgi:hypothetical protein